MTLDATATPRTRMNPIDAPANDNRFQKITHNPLRHEVSGEF
jgi:hypothetical protein